MFYRKSIAILFLFSFTAFAANDGKFSERAWHQILPIYKSIVEHPFNKELMKGTLPQKVFAHYSAQDSLYLIDFTKSLALLAAKLDDPSDIAKIMGLVRESTIEKKATDEKNTSRQLTTEAAPATILYTNYLLMVASYKSREELAAALLPCFWIYLKLADDLKDQQTPSNPYTKWIETYSSANYRKSVNVMIALTDKLADRASPETKAKMLDSFVLASRMEWYFWDGAYRTESWKP